VLPDEQPTLLSSVAEHADQATFDQLHAIAKSANNETEAQRYFSALMMTRDPKLAQQSLAIALSPEIPKQSEALRFRLVGLVAEYKPAAGLANIYDEPANADGADEYVRSANYGAVCSAHLSGSRAASRTQALGFRTRARCPPTTILTGALDHRKCYP
jgi:hypothetical protein